MLRLTNSQGGTPLLLNVNHIVAVREERGQVYILTSTGVEYIVRETYDDLAKREIWNRV